MWHRKHILVTPTIVLLIGVSIFVPLIYVYDNLLFQNNKSISSAQFKSIIQSISTSVQEDNVGEVLASYVNTPCVDLEEYRKTIRSLPLDEGFYFVTTKVLDQNRLNFEKELSKMYNMTSVIINQLDLEPVEQKDLYWPVLYHPLDFGRGVDMFSNPLLKSAIEETLRTKDISYSLPILAIDTGDISIMKTFPVEGSVDLIVTRFTKLGFLVELNVDIDSFLSLSSTRYLRIEMVDEDDEKYLGYENGNKKTDKIIFTSKVKLSSTRSILLEGFEEIQGIPSGLLITFYVFGTLISIACSVWEFIRSRLNKKTLLLSKKYLEASKEKSMFVSNMSHEIRTPLNGIIGMTDLMVQHSISKDEQYCVDVIKSCCSTLLNVVNTILDMASVESGNIEIIESTINIRSIVLEIVSDLWVSMFTKRSTLLEKVTVHISKTVPNTIVSDGGRISQVVTNLVTNALKYTPSGEINISLDIKDIKEKKIRVELKVRDSGIGLSDEEQKGLFAPFSRFHTTTHVEGTGLGLCISKSISKAMNGDIICRSEKGIGSEFTFYFIIDGVLSEDNEECTQEFNKSFLGHTNRSESENVPITSLYTLKNDSKILIVDDVRVNRIVLRKQLEKMGGIVFLAENGLQAVDMCSEQVYDVIFMDSVMPIMSGIESTKLIRSNTVNRSTPLIFLTADVLKESIDSYMKSGATGFMPKPFRIENLVSILIKKSSCIVEKKEQVIDDADLKSLYSDYSKSRYSEDEFY